MPRLFTSLIALFALLAPAMAAERPNILLCVADDWGWPHAGAYGDRVVKTPAFDRLAREGVLFEHAFVSAPSCTPSRNAMLTGQQFYRLDQGANLQATLDVKHPNFMRLLERAGYRIGHWRKVWGPGVFEAGGYEQHPAGPGMSFEEFLKKRAKDEPFCFWFGTSDPHRPYKTGSGAAAGIELSAIRVPAFLPDNEVTRSDIADYYFEVQRWDSDVAKAIELLEAAGELENTIIVMTSDNGMPFPRCKGSLYDWGSRAPLAIRWGMGIEAPGRRIDAFVSLTELAPTFLAAGGVAVPEVMTEQSLLPLLQNERGANHAPERAFAVTGRERHAAAQEMPSLAGYPSRAIRTERYLFIMNLEPQRWPHGVPQNATHPIGEHADTDDSPTKAFILAHRDEPEYQRYYELCFGRRSAEELYDVQADADQVNNLAARPEHHETVQQLHDRLTAYLRRTGDPRFTNEPVQFDEHPYRDDRIHRRIKEWREQQQSRNAPADLSRD
ncbi:MAG TPA: sulfatase [Tepidisphaeraceae bacterium]|nr:sulfatase [Tepidisphaeraceae bacterium]